MKTEHVPFAVIYIGALVASVILGVSLGRNSDPPVAGQGLGSSVEAALQSRLELQEGWRDTVYVDSRGIRTVGYGHDLEVPMPRDLGGLILRFDIESAAARLEARWPEVAAQPDDVRVALIDMAFQLGVDGELAFRDMVAAVTAGDWEAAAQAVEASHWEAETRARAEWVAGVFRAQEGR